MTSSNLGVYNKDHYILDKNSGKVACGRKLGPNMWTAHSEYATTCGHCIKAIYRSWEKEAEEKEQLKRNRERKYGELKKLNPDAIIDYVFDDAYIGWAEKGGVTVAVFYADKCLEILQKKDGWTYEKAKEYFYSILEEYTSEYKPENTPLFLWRKCPYPDCVVCEDESTQEVE